MGYMVVLGVKNNASRTGKSGVASRRRSLKPAGGIILCIVRNSLTQLLVLFGPIETGMTT